MKTSILRPGPGLWNCCKDNPGGVISFADGTAVLACRRCTSTVGFEYRHPLPEIKYGTCDFCSSVCQALVTTGPEGWTCLEGCRQTEGQVVVVFDVTGPSSETVHRFINTLLDRAKVVGTVDTESLSQLVSWWMPTAEGRAVDGNDNTEMHLVPVGG